LKLPSTKIYAFLALKHQKSYACGIGLVKNVKR